VLLRRREEKGLLGGMIEVPSTPWREAGWGEMEAMAAAPVAVAWTPLPGTVQHGFTHFQLELTIWAATTESSPNGVWARPDQFNDYAFPTLTKKVVKHALSVLEG
jgi:A/G-specific adenine glycosylase